MSNLVAVKGKEHTMLTTNRLRKMMKVLAVCALSAVLWGTLSLPAAQADTPTLSVWAPDLAVWNVYHVVGPSAIDPKINTDQLVITIGNQGSKTSGACWL